MRNSVGKEAFFFFCIYMQILWEAKNMIINVHVNILDSHNIFQASALSQMLKSWPVTSRWWLSDYVLIIVLNVILLIVAWYKLEGV